MYILRWVQNSLEENISIQMMSKTALHVVVVLYWKHTYSFLNTYM